MSDRFDLDAHVAAAYAAWPSSLSRPVVGITGNYDGVCDVTLRDRYCSRVAAAGGVPVIIPPIEDKSVIISTIEALDGIVLSGGGDHDPLWMGEQPQPGLGAVSAVRDLPELLLTRLAVARNVPILGICRGIQTIAIALGGHVMQDMQPSDVRHSQEEEREVATHVVTLEPRSVLAEIYGASAIAVNSFHHQCVDRVGEHLRVTARAADGAIEGVESADHRPVLGVQWHPEWLGEEGMPPFRRLVDEAALYRRAKRLHAEMVTIDSHCDTPMLFPQGADFRRRDALLLVDLPKMCDGRLDAATMAAYVPQPRDGERWSDVAPLPSATPADYVDIIFRRTVDMVNDSEGRIAIARTPHDVVANKRAGRRSVFLAIENALAVEGDMSLVSAFARRGAVYFTLCHNGDNALCDSALRTRNTHGGVSARGAEVIREMNRCGVMVDLSHGGERSFYDALDISAAPIVCSHSCCRGLCDTPRNLSDDQMRALARRGGVMQVTLYEGFLRRGGTASILDAMAHIDHAVAVMGADHVGIGSDFDGGGGVAGLADSSDMLLLTRQMLLRRYSDDVIALLWGGNWLRVMEQVQRAAGAAWASETVK